MSTEEEYTSEEVTEIRRNIRRKQREIVSDVQKHREDIGLPDDLIEQVVKLDKLLHSDLLATKEAAIDSDGFRLLSSIGRAHVEAARGNLIQFDNVTYAEKLVTYMGGRRGAGRERDMSKCLDWDKLGKRVARIYKRPPSTKFVFGALELEPLKKRAARSHSKRDKEVLQGAAAKPKEVKDLHEEEESTTKDVQHIMIQVLQACREKGRVGYFHFLVDPTSFAKTIENMFHFAFLVKDGRVGVALGRDGIPYIFLPAKTVCDTGQSVKSTKNQFITSLTVQDWKRAIEKFNIRSASIPPRKP